MAELIDRQKPADFLFRRIIRIYPPFLIAVILTLVLSSVSLFGTSWTHIFLIPAGPDRSALLVEWTLVHEMFFYFVVFAVAVLGGKKYLPIIALIWLTAIVVSGISGVQRPMIGLATITDLPLMYANSGFAAGLLIPTILKFFRNASVLFLFFCLVFICTYYFPGALSRMWAGVGSAGLISAAVIFTPSLPKYADALLSRWGDWSYGLYLVHVPIIRSALFYMQPTVTPEVAFPIIIILTLIGGAAMGVIDLRMHSVLRSYAQKTSNFWISALIFFVTIAYIIACAINA